MSQSWPRVSCRRTLALMLVLSPLLASFLYGGIVIATSDATQQVLCVNERGLTYMPDPGLMPQSHESYLRDCHLVELTPQQRQGYRDTGWFVVSLVRLNIAVMGGTIFRDYHREKRLTEVANQT